MTHRAPSTALLIAAWGLYSLTARADNVEEALGRLRSPVASTRMEAAYTLAGVGAGLKKRADYGRVFPALLAASGDPVESVRGQAVRALANVVDRSSVPLLTRALIDGTNAWRRAGAATLLGLTRDPQALPVLERAAKDRSSIVRGAVVDALNTMGGASAGNAIRPLLADPDPRVRLKASVALGRLHDTRSVSVLIQLLRDPHTEVQSQAALSLAELGDRRVVPALKRMLRQDVSAQGKMIAKTTFGTCFYAAFALGALGDASATPLLIRGLSDKDKFVRSQAANALGRMRDTRAVVPLTHTVLHDPFVLARFGAAQSLGRLRDKRAVPFLVQSLRDANEDVREQSAKALGALGDKRAVPPLIAALKDTDEAVPRAALLALGRIGDPAALPAARNLLRHKDASVRQAASEAIALLAPAVHHSAVRP